MRNEQRRSRRAHALLSMGVATLVLAGCNRRTQQTNLSMTQEAESLYTYGDEREPIDIEDPNFPGKAVDENDFPVVTIATATAQPGNPPREGIVLARITSNRDFPEFGLKQGPNYLWRVPASSSGNPRDSVNQIFPAGHTSMSYQLTRHPGMHELSPGSREVPRLVRVKVHSLALGACLDEEMCKPSGHCGYY